MGFNHIYSSIAGKPRGQNIENELLSGGTDGETDPFIKTLLALFPARVLAMYVQKWLKCQATAGKVIRRFGSFFFFYPKRNEYNEDVQTILPLGEDRHNPCPFLNARYCGIDQGWASKPAWLSALY